MGSKRRVAAQLIPYFPPHELYVELFFGAGGMFFAKPLAMHTIANDVDEEVYNLWLVARDRRGELAAALQELPYHERVLERLKASSEADPVRRAARFLYLSNYTIMSKGCTMRFSFCSPLEEALRGLEAVQAKLRGVQLMCCDFREALDKIQFIKGGRKGRDDRRRAFIYADPPYVGTATGMYGRFGEQDFVGLLDALCASGVRFAVSELDTPLVRAEAQRRGLRVHTICARRNLKNRCTEALITSYDVSPALF
jgi:DNA adenine methylase